MEGSSESELPAVSHTHTAAALARSHSLMQGFLGHFLSAFSFYFQLLCGIKMALAQEPSYVGRILP